MFDYFNLSQTPLISEWRLLICYWNQWQAWCRMLHVIASWNCAKPNEFLSHHKPNCCRARDSYAWVELTPSVQSLCLNWGHNPKEQKTRVVKLFLSRVRRHTPLYKDMVTGQSYFQFIFKYQSYFLLWVGLIPSSASEGPARTFDVSSHWLDCRQKTSFSFSKHLSKTVSL